VPPVKFLLEFDEELELQARRPKAFFRGEGSG
jgi:hypothetical protein